MEKNKYKVIWIDDEYDKMLAFRRECEKIHDIQLTPFRTQKEGMEALDRDIDGWDAVLLDAKMFDQSVNEQADIYGLTNAIKHIEGLSLRRKIPYFISTGQPDLMDNKMFEKAYGKYYIKGNDDYQLMLDMLDAISKSETNQIRALYSDVIRSMNDIDTRGVDIILRIFKALHFPANHPDFDAKLHYTQLRLLVEYIFRRCHNQGIIPLECIPDGKVNLNQCYNYLIGNDGHYSKVRYGDNNERIVDVHIERILDSILNFGNIASHTTELSPEDEKVFDRGISKYLIMGLALQLCEAILWFDNYINTHSDIEKNLSKCVYLLENQTQHSLYSSDINYYSQKEFLVDVDDQNNVHCEGCILPHGLLHLKGHMVSLYNIAQNDKPKTKNKYPFFAKCKKND